MKLIIYRPGEAENATFLGSWSFQHGEVSLVLPALLCSRFSLTLNRALHLADLITEMNGKRS
jgi:hypothetical protein